MKPETKALNKIIRAIVKCSDDLDPHTSIPDYKLQCVLVGVQASLSNDEFVKWLMGKFVQESSSSPELFDAVVSSLNEIKFLDPIKNEMHSDILMAILDIEVMNNHDCFKVIGDYCIKNFPTSTPGKYAHTVARATGLTCLLMGDLNESRSA